MQLKARLFTLCMVCLAFFLLPGHTVESAPPRAERGQQTPATLKVLKKKAAKARKKAARNKATAKKGKKRKKRKKAQRPQWLRSWLALGPAAAPMPAFFRERKRKRYTMARHLMSKHLQVARLRPKAGGKHDWFLGKALTWKASKGRFRIRGGSPQVGYLATYIEVPQYAEVKLKLQSHQRLRVFLNGKVVATKAGCTTYRRRKGHKKRSKKGKKRKKRKKHKKSPKAAKKAAPASQPAAKKGLQALLLRLTELLARQTEIIQSQARTIARQLRQLQKRRIKPKRRRRWPAGVSFAKLKLVPGVHQLVIKTMYSRGCVRRWWVRGSLHASKKSAIPRGLKTTRAPYVKHSMGFYFHRKKLGAVSLSPDGSQVLIHVYRYNRRGMWEQWVEVRRIKDGKLLRTHVYPRIRAISWSPDGKHYSFVTRHGKKWQSSLWIGNSQTGQVRVLRRGIKGLGGVMWSPDSRFLVYSRNDRTRPTRIEKTGAKRLRGMGDRWPWYRRHSHLYAITLKKGQVLRLTTGNWSAGGPSIRHDGKKMLFTRTRPNYKARPFHRTDLYELDLKTLKAKKLFANLLWLSAASYGPKGEQILMVGGPSLFGYFGRNPNMPQKVTLNDYEKDLYIYNLKTRKYRALTRQFKPHVTRAYWHPLDGKIYATVLDGTRYKLVRYDPDQASFSDIPLGVDVAYRIQFARNSSQIAYVGQGIAHPARLFTLDLFSPSPKELYDPNEQWFSRLNLATVKDFVTYSRKGHRIEGRYYLPPDFDPRKKYPVIVYYYGGTFPTPRYFDGSFSGQLWASHGFVTYIVQPSGAIGYGQKHATRHVNEWGTIVASEIIQATKAFVKAHPFVDGKRLGCIGASYGGFMTMSIVTKTKLFAAAISHAGISNITSYWGAGFWGFWYSAIATAGRYPWTHPYFYVKNSPLFHAHKVTTPLLLIHGKSDNNVPPAESYQMYTALRLLKKKVELVVFKKEGHGVANPIRRKIWLQTILAWFSKHLKKQPLWWKKMYGTKQY